VLDAWWGYLDAENAFSTMRGWETELQMRRTRRAAARRAASRVGGFQCAGGEGDGSAAGGEGEGGSDVGFVREKEGGGGVGADGEGCGGESDGANGEGGVGEKDGGGGDGVDGEGCGSERDGANGEGCVGEKDGGGGDGADGEGCVGEKDGGGGDGADREGCVGESGAADTGRGEALRCGVTEEEDGGADDDDVAGHGRVRTGRNPVLTPFHQFVFALVVYHKFRDPEHNLFSVACKLFHITERTGARCVSHVVLTQIVFFTIVFFLPCALYMCGVISSCSLLLVVILLQILREIYGCSVLLLPIPTTSGGWGHGHGVVSCTNTGKAAVGQGDTRSVHWGLHRTLGSRPRGSCFARILVQPVQGKDDTEIPGTLALLAA